MRGVRRVNETILLVGCSVLPRAVLPLVFSVRSRGTRNTVLSPRRGNPSRALVGSLEPPLPQERV